MAPPNIVAPIPLHLEPAVMLKAGEGAGHAEIAEYLNSRHGLSCTRADVARVMARTLGAQADVVKHAVRGQVAKSVERYIAILDKSINRLTELEDYFWGEDGKKAKEKPGPFLSAHEACRKTIDTMLRHSGADTPDEKPDLAAYFADLERREKAKAMAG